MNLLQEIYESMERSDLIALIAVCFTALAALYARWAATQARKANEISIQSELKPRRLVVYASVKDFLHFCSTYETMQFLKMVQGTTELVAKIETFIWEVEQHGPLDMPEVENLIENARKRAWQLQRLLDRLKGPDAKPIGTNIGVRSTHLTKISFWYKKEVDVYQAQDYHGKAIENNISRRFLSHYLSG